MMPVVPMFHANAWGVSLGLDTDCLQPCDPYFKPFLTGCGVTAVMIPVCLSAAMPRCCGYWSNVGAAWSRPNAQEPGEIVRRRG